MNIKLRIIFSILALPLICHAQSGCQDPCCLPSDPCTKCTQIWPSHGPDWIITPNAGLCVSGGWDVGVICEFLYWTAREDNLAFAFKESAQFNTITNEGRVFRPDWNFEPGFKVGVNILQNHDGWDVLGSYTWLRVRNTKKTVRSDDPVTERISPVGGAFVSGGITEIERISGRWELDFSVIDLELGRSFFISSCLKLRPHFGLKGILFDQEYQVETLGSFENAQADGVYQNSMDNWGIGICGGLDSSWYLTKSISFLGEIAACALWERFEVKSKSLNTPLIIGPTNPITLLDIESNFFSIKPVLELLLGLRWETWFCCDRYHFNIDGAWEIQWWPGQNQFFLPLLETRCGDLFLHGLTLRFRLDF